MALSTSVKPDTFQILVLEVSIISPSSIKNDSEFTVNELLAASTEEIKNDAFENSELATVFSLIVLSTATKLAPCKLIFATLKLSSPVLILVNVTLVLLAGKTFAGNTRFALLIIALAFALATIILLSICCKSITAELPVYLT